VVVRSGSKWFRGDSKLVGGGLRGGSLGFHCDMWKPVCSDSRWFGGGSKLARGGWKWIRGGSGDSRGIRGDMEMGS
jgi:hypothetical protein